MLNTDKGGILLSCELLTVSAGVSLEVFEEFCNKNINNAFQLMMS